MRCCSESKYVTPSCCCCVSSKRPLRKSSIVLAPASYHLCSAAGPAPNTLPISRLATYSGLAATCTAFASWPVLSISPIFLAMRSPMPSRARASSALRMGAVCSLSALMARWYEYARQRSLPNCDVLACSSSTVRLSMMSWLLLPPSTAPLAPGADDATAAGGGECGRCAIGAGAAAVGGCCGANCASGSATPASADSRYHLVVTSVAAVWRPLSSSRARRAGASVTTSAAGSSALMRTSVAP
mmetsp:Transcript_52397/g.128566  ORF Transcript_52397/g.128566 Transcript_52397/m.128566 type:complete len:243 (+) Transcript_52397:516-1244(+)